VVQLQGGFRGRVVILIARQRHLQLQPLRARLELHLRQQRSPIAWAGALLSHMQ
jgi:hypothetical protein